VKTEESESEVTTHRESAAILFTKDKRAGSQTSSDLGI
jgi:hypothetical protein